MAPRTISMVGRVREAQRLRGMDTTRWRTLPALAVPVLETGMEEAVTLAESMDARGHGRGRRTRYRPEHWTAAAIGTAVSAVVAAAVFVGASWIGRGGMHPSTAPLRWPGVDPGLLVALSLLAIPGFLPRQTEREST
jgi:energy-coupling factor transport system permease protein